MRRGDIVTLLGGFNANKPRPALIVQDDRFDATIVDGLPIDKHRSRRAITTGARRCGPREWP